LLASIKDNNFQLQPQAQLQIQACPLTGGIPSF